MRFRILAAAIGAALLGFTLPASAGTLGVSYSGIVTAVGAAGMGQFAVNDTFTLDIVVDDSVPDTAPAIPGIGDYHGVTQFNGSFSNGYTFATTTGTDRLIVYDGGTDGVEFNGHNFAAADIGGFHLQLVSAMFNDSTAMMNAGEAMPTDLVSLLSLSDSQQVFLQFLDWSSGDAFFVSLAITSAAPLSTVPIPAALPLLASALGGLGFFGWRRRRLA